MIRTVKGVDYFALRRGYDEVQYEQEATPLAWPRCEITDCPHGICIGLSKSLCYKHGIQFGAFTVDEFEADRKTRHPGR